MEENTKIRVTAYKLYLYLTNKSNHMRLKEKLRLKDHFKETLKFTKSHFSYEITKYTSKLYFAKLFVFLKILQIFWYLGKVLEKF